MKHEFDILVIGSGMAGLHAVYDATLEGFSVGMLDVGEDGHAPLESGRAATFGETRRENPRQREIFLGGDFSAIGADAEDRGHAGSMTSGRRGYVVRGAERYAPIRSDATVLQSFARGGLSEAWGGACDFFDDEECRAVGIPPEELSRHYPVIIDRIGVSGPKGAFPLQGAAKVDDNAATLLQAYASQREKIGQIGFTLSEASLALLTEDLGPRKKTAYRDMDFWDNIGRSVYRGHYTLEELLTRENFSYLPDIRVTSVVERDNTAQVSAVHTRSDETYVFTAKALIVAAGAVNTTRILLRSFQLFERPVPVILKNNYLVPCLLPSKIGRAVPHPRKHSLCQLVMRGNDRTDGMVDPYVQLYSYESLLLYKLLRFIPLAAPEAFYAASVIAPAMVLADIRFPSITETTHRSTLRTDTHDKEYLHIEHPERQETALAQKQKVRSVKRALRALGLLPLASVKGAWGATSHYASGVPFSERGEDPSDTPLSTNARGQLHGSPRIFVADSATWRALPAKPPGLTIMANANRIGSHVIDFIRKKD